MDVVVTVDQRFERAPDGSVWTQTQFPYAFWTRYLGVFDRVGIIARANETPATNAHWKRVDGDGVFLIDIPDFQGPQQYLLRRRRVTHALQKAISLRDAVILRVASQLANAAMPKLYRNKFPYGLEVVTDPYGTFAPGGVKHPLRPFFRRWLSRQLRHQCAAASAAAYVTQDYLQTHYPCKGYSVGVSDVEISDMGLAKTPRPAPNGSLPYTLVFVGSLEQPYKRLDVLINATVICLQDELDLQVQVIGDGKHRHELEAQAAAADIKDRIMFLGHLTSAQAVRDQLDQSDLFVMPSRHESMPRAMIEAMARGLPCIGTCVGGIPELLPPEDLISPNDAPALAQKIREMLMNPDRMTSASARNLEKAKQFHETKLREYRTAFYQYVKDATAAWLAKYPQL